MCRRSRRRDSSGLRAKPTGTCGVTLLPLGASCGASLPPSPPPRPKRGVTGNRCAGGEPGGPPVRAAAGAC